VFGAGALNSAFTAAFTLPNLFRRLLGEGALTAAFVPTMSEALARQRRDGAFELVSKVASWLLVVTMAIVGLAMLLLTQAGLFARLAGVAADSTTLPRLLLGAELAIVLFPYMVFVCLAAAFSAACQVLGRFNEPAWSPVWLNCCILAALGGGAWFAWGDAARMNLLCLGVLAGGFSQMAVPAWVLWREGWRPDFDLRVDDRVRQIVRLMGPTVISSAIYLVNMAVSRLVGLSLNDSAAAVLNLATRVMELPIGVFTIAVATVVFPLIAGHAARQDWAQLAADYHKGLRLVLIINVPAAAGLVLLSEPVTRLLFQRGQFAATDTALMTPVLAVCALGLPFISHVSLALRAFYALKDTSTPVRAAAVSFTVNLGLSLLLMRWWGTSGLAAAGTLAVVAQSLYLQAKLAGKQPGLGLAPLAGDLGKILAAAAGMTALTWAGARGVAAAGLPGKAGDWVVVLGLIPLSAAAYGAALWALKVGGREEVLQLLRRGR
jgi:putative peptidoglycan lipid II flippase